MDTREAPAPLEGWTCACGHRNGAVPACPACGVTRRWLEDPPLDVPPAPTPFERPAGWLALLHAALAVGGAFLLWRPEVAPLFALAPAVQAAQVAASLAAAGSSWNRAMLDRLLWRVALDVPDRARAGEPFRAVATVVPHEGLAGVRVRLELAENTYERGADGRSGVRTRTRVLARDRHLEGGRLPGRRATTFETAFTAPYPTGQHRDVHAELQASLLGALAGIVPGLGEAARNLREHGGVWVRLTVRVGPWRRRIERRVLVYDVSGDRLRVG